MRDHRYSKTSILPFIYLSFKLNHFSNKSREQFTPETYRYRYDTKRNSYSSLFFPLKLNRLKIISRRLTKDRIGFVTHLANSSSFASSSVSEPRGLPLGVEPLLLNVTLLLSSLSDLVNFEAVPC